MKLQEQMTYKPAWDLSTIPDTEFYSEAGRRRQRLRKEDHGGRPKKLKPCPKCGAKFGARELRAHKCG